MAPALFFSPRFRVPLFATLLVLARPAGASAVCPENTIWTGCHDLVGWTTTAPSSRYGGGPWQAGTFCDSGCYDLTSGALTASGVGNPYSEACGSSLRL